MTLAGRLVRVTDLSPDQRDAMFALMRRYFENVNRDRFDFDLGQKEWVIQVLEPATGELCGFSTQMLLDVDVAGRPIKALFSGDTIVAPDQWGDPNFVRAAGRFALSVIDTFPSAELYWFLMSESYRTYRFLTRFFVEFYPRYDRATPAWAKKVIDALGSCKAPGRYDPATGVARADPVTDRRLRPGLAEVTAAQLRDPHARFFVGRNPGHACGDNLCCIAPLTRQNFTPAAWVVLHSLPGLPCPVGVG